MMETYGGKVSAQNRHSPSLLGSAHRGTQMMDNPLPTPTQCSLSQQNSAPFMHQRPMTQRVSPFLLSSSADVVIKMSLLSSNHSAGSMESSWELVYLQRPPPPLKDQLASSAMTPLPCSPSAAITWETISTIG